MKVWFFIIITENTYIYMILNGKMETSSIMAQSED